MMYVILRIMITLTPPSRGNFVVEFLWQRSARHKKATEKLLAVHGFVRDCRKTG